MLGGGVDWQQVNIPNKIAEISEYAGIFVCSN
jgi:hypothetical protein